MGSRVKKAPPYAFKVHIRVLQYSMLNVDCAIGMETEHNNFYVSWGYHSYCHAHTTHTHNGIYSETEATTY